MKKEESKQEEEQEEEEQEEEEERAARQDIPLRRLCRRAQTLRRHVLRMAAAGRVDG